MRKLVLAGLILSIGSVYAMEEDDKDVCSGATTGEREEETLEAPQGMTMNRNECEECDELRVAKKIFYNVCCCGCLDDVAQKFVCAQNLPACICMGTASYFIISSTGQATKWVLGKAMEYAVPHAAYYASHYYDQLAVASQLAAGCILAKKLIPKTKALHQKAE